MLCFRIFIFRISIIGSPRENWRNSPALARTVGERGAKKKDEKKRWEMREKKSDGEREGKNERWKREGKNNDRVATPSRRRDADVVS